MFLRPLVILLIFFGTLFYFKDDLSGVAPRFDQLHSAYADSFKKLFKEITSATSSSLLNPGTNYIPQGNSTSTSVKTSTVETLTPEVDLAASSKTKELLPVVSNQSGEDLTISGIIYETNKERRKAGLPELMKDPQLSQSAEMKLQDMFQRQYFQHISPTGDSVSDVVRKTGYEYIVVGENLALGIFPGDEQVVAAWMASPGHKKNILDSRYKEIGLAVGQGMYQGRRQWLVVQHFAKPLSACTTPAPKLKNTVDIQKNEVEVLEQKIVTVRAQIDGLTGDAYTEKANEYNALVIEYNAKLTTLKASTDAYNEAVRAFNACAGI
jgi:uncharacterized protein YkwD